MLITIIILNSISASNYTLILNIKYIIHNLTITPISILILIITKIRHLFDIIILLSLSNISYLFYYILLYIIIFYIYCILLYLIM